MVAKRGTAMLGWTIERLKWALVRRCLPDPVKARHSEYSMLHSEDDALSRPSEYLLEVSHKAIEAALQTDLGDLAGRLKGRFPYPDDIANLWPGEHYRLLAGLVQVLSPKLVIEIGTAEGLSSLSMQKYLPDNGQIVSFDIVPWRQYPRSCLVEDDFRRGNLKQIVADLGQSDVFDNHREFLADAGLIFIDAAKDGVLEQNLIRFFETVPFRSRPIFLFDDTRLWNMLSIWRDLRWPKLDLTSFGHWAGTGLCERGLHVPGAVTTS
ncbi:O-methyltransferase [Singulisphaera sp. GP187]|nr:O-methyltransferase [Singulisphaera sp. GP187]